MHVTFPCPTRSVLNVTARSTDTVVPTVPTATQMTIVDNEGQANACPKLIAATGYTYVPTATPMCESPAGAHDNPAQPSA